MFDYSLPADCGVVTKTAPLPVALFKAGSVFQTRLGGVLAARLLVVMEMTLLPAPVVVRCCLLRRWSSGSGVEVVVVGEGDEMVLWW
jgi:hypothetical protein